MQPSNTDQVEPIVATSNVKKILGSWESRASESGVKNFPRKISPSWLTKKNNDHCESPIRDKHTPQETESPRSPQPVERSQLLDPDVSSTRKKNTHVDVSDEMPKVGTIRERMKAFQRQHENELRGSQGAHFKSPKLRGKRASVPGLFTPKIEKSSLKDPPSDGNGIRLPQIDLSSVVDASQNVNEDGEKLQSPISNSLECQKEKKRADVTTEEKERSKEENLDIRQVEGEIEEPTALELKPQKLDRDALVLKEIRKMIKDTEDNELEDDMDEEIKQVLEDAALASTAYTKKWYDALSDSWIHCPSLATIIMNFSLLEAADELYGDELPMLYTCSLRAVASEVLNGEEELPEYVQRLAI